MFVWSSELDIREVLNQLLVISKTVNDVLIFVFNKINMIQRIAYKHTHTICVYNY